MTQITHFKVGDKIRLKSEYYKEQAFKEEPRDVRKCIADANREPFYASHVELTKGVCRISSLDSHCMFSIPSDCCELAVEPVQEVQRTAKVCEWIKFVDAHPTSTQTYKNGDIRNVEFYSERTMYIEMPEGRCVRENEYVVLENYIPEKEPQQRKWTNSEIREAKEIIGESAVNSILSRDFVTAGYKGKSTYVQIHSKKFTASCCPADEYNTYIGMMVAFCKATGRNLPEWIQRGVK